MSSRDAAAVLATCGIAIAVGLYASQGETMPAVLAVTLAIILFALMSYYSIVVVIELVRLARKVITK